MVTQKAKILLLAAALTAPSLAARAQLFTAVRLTADSVRLSYRLQLPQPKSDYSYLVTPVLRWDTCALELPQALVRGRLNAQKDRRRQRLHSRPTADYIPAGAAAELTGQVSLSRRELTRLGTQWLRLCQRVEGEGCCEAQEPYTVCGDSVEIRRPFAPVFAPVEDFTGRAGALQRDNPVLLHISKYQPYTAKRVLRKEKGALYVHFPLSKTTLLHDFRTNAPTLDRIVSITRQIMADTASSVKCIQIIGLASPEGPIRGNIRLAGGRGQALKQYIQRQVGAPDSLFEVCNGGEAWTELRDQIADTQMDGRDQLLDIIDHEPDADRRERRMKALDGGRPYAYLRDNVLADQRNSGYLRIYYDYVPDTIAARINRATDLIAREQYAEALQMLQTVRHDPRSLNAIGVCLYMLGREQDAVEAFRQSPAEEAKKNLEQLQ